MIIFAGPCGVLPLEEMEREVGFLYQFKNDCDLVIRGGAWKGQLYPDRKMVHGKWVDTPEEYVGYGDAAVDVLGAFEAEYDLPTCTEVMSSEHVERCRGSVTWAQVGTRHMGNLPLLRHLRGWGGPVVLKRGMGNGIVEWLGAREHILYKSDNTVVLCERGIVSHEASDPRIRWRPDILAIAQIKADHPDIPVILDCSHSTGRRDLVLPMAKAAIAAGADGLMIEVMADPDQSMTDAAQGVNHEQFAKIMEAVL